MGECFFWYWPMWAVPDKGPLNSWVCVYNHNGNMYRLFSVSHIKFVRILQMQYGYMRAFPRRRSDSFEVNIVITEFIVQCNCYTVFQKSTVITLTCIYHF